MPIHRTSCCGVRSIPDISIYKTPEEVVKSILPDLLAIKGAFVVFTCTTNRKLGRRLVNYILEKKFGVVTETDYVPDGKKNNVRAFIWAFEMKELKKFYESYVPVIKVGMKVRVNELWMTRNGERYGRPEGEVYSAGDSYGPIAFKDEKGNRWGATHNEVDII